MFADRLDTVSAEKKMRLLVLLATIGLIFCTDPLDDAEKYIERECPCDPSKLWLDIVIAIDTSIGMTEEGLTQVLADIATVFDTTKFAQGEGHHSRISIVTYADNATTRYGLKDIESNEDLMNKIWNIENGDQAVSNLKIEEDENDAKQLAYQIKISGTDIIVVPFDQGGKPNHLIRLKEIATPGYYFPNTILNLANEIQQALCTTNCFCKRQWTQYQNTFGESTVKFGECVRIGGIDANWVSAKRACARMGNGQGHLANIFDLSKHNFVAQLFKNDYRVEPPYIYHIGLSYNQEKKAYVWDRKAGSEPLPLDGGTFKKWNKGFPVSPENIKDYGCVVSAQDGTSFELGWQDINCRTVPKHYICQMETCDTTNYCPNINK
ncbi:lectin C-type domain protein [Oesophagostomum dentatum]|uniref:Lectin C-type domain protein n=1 Tax=Oesophagostomum dentatum TaxID=61180 RepID=A0A0B1SL50_OESDE|nr:lectin C-type domain protein [Oesophagostomum dentatum]